MQFCVLSPELCICIVIVITSHLYKLRIVWFCFMYYPLPKLSLFLCCSPCSNVSCAVDFEIFHLIMNINILASVYIEIKI